jgi:hypothetical protein
MQMTGLTPVPLIVAGRKINEGGQKTHNSAMEQPMTVYRRNLVESRAHKLAQTDNASSVLKKSTKKGNYRPSSPSSLLVATSTLSAERPPAPERLVKDRLKKKHFSPPVEVRLNRSSVPPRRPPVTERFKQNHRLLSCFQVLARAVNG